MALATVLLYSMRESMLAAATHGLLAAIHSAQEDIETRSRCSWGLRELCVSAYPLTLTSHPCKEPDNC